MPAGLHVCVSYDGANAANFLSFDADDQKEKEKHLLML